MRIANCRSGKSIIKVPLRKSCLVAPTSAGCALLFYVPQEIEVSHKIDIASVRDCRLFRFGLRYLLHITIIIKHQKLQDAAFTSFVKNWFRG